MRPQLCNFAPSPVQFAFVTDGERVSEAGAANWIGNAHWRRPALEVGLSGCDFE